LCKFFYFKKIVFHFSFFFLSHVQLPLFFNRHVLQRCTGANVMFVWPVADVWCWFVLREKYCWLVADDWFVVREKYCWLVADKPNKQGDGVRVCTPGTCSEARVGPATNGRKGSKRGSPVLVCWNSFAPDARLLISNPHVSGAPPDRIASSFSPAPLACLRSRDSSP
jgi:hypothetical protein